MTKVNLDKVPEDRYQRKQTLRNAERFSTPELKKHEALILEAQEKSKTLEYQLFVKVRDAVKNNIKRLQSLANAISSLDVLQGFAAVSEKYRWIKPRLTNGSSLRIVAGRHPVVEKVMGHQSYVPNNVIMDRQTQILLITGPNMSGKSTYMRQLALTVIMAQMGCFIPAKSAVMPVFDQIFTRIGAADNLIAGQSTFMVEMQESNEALQNATPHSLILFDELGRGTATYDGMSLAQAIIEYVHNHIHAKTLISTHYHGLTKLAQRLPHLKNVHVGATEKNGDLVFLHKVEAGPADKSYGIHVAQLAGLPRTVLSRAREVLGSLVASGSKTSRRQTSMASRSRPLNLVSEKKVNRYRRANQKLRQELKERDSVAKGNNNDRQLALFTTPAKPKKFRGSRLNAQDRKVITELKRTDLMSETPMALMNKVYKWQRRIK